MAVTVVRDGPVTTVVLDRPERRGADGAPVLGLVDRVVDDGAARTCAEVRAHQLAALPQACLREDRLSVRAAMRQSIEGGLRTEHAHGLRSLAAGVEGGDAASGRAHRQGAELVAAGEGRHGSAT